MADKDKDGVADAGPFGGPLGYLFGGNTGISNEDLKRRRAIALALAARGRGFPKNIGEGLTYFGESLGEAIGDWRLRGMEEQQARGDRAALAPTAAEPTPVTPPQRQKVSDAPPAAATPRTAYAPPDAPVETPAPPEAPVAAAPWVMDDRFNAMSGGGEEPAPVAVVPPSGAMPDARPVPTESFPRPPEAEPVEPPPVHPGQAAVFQSNSPPYAPPVGPPASFSDRFAALGPQQAGAFDPQPYDRRALVGQGGPIDPAVAFNPQPDGWQPQAGPQTAEMPMPRPRPPGADMMAMPRPRPAEADAPPPSGYAYGGKPLPPAWEAAIARQPPELQNYLRQMALKETGLREGVVSSTGAAGPLQFTRGTGRAYGLVGSGVDRRGDPDAAFDAGTRLTQANAAGLRKALGREPTYQDLAGAHQQGLGGYTALTQGRLPPSRNLAVNNLPGSAQAALSKLHAYYGFPPGVGPSGGGSPTAVAAAPPEADPATIMAGPQRVPEAAPLETPDVRDAVTMALMQQPKPQQAAASEEDVAAEARMRDVLGGGRRPGSPFAPRALASRGDIGSDAPMPGLSPLGSATGDAISNSVQQRQRIYDAVQQQGPAVPPPDPTQAAVTPPEISPPSTSPTGTGSNPPVISDIQPAPTGVRPGEVTAQVRDTSQGIKPVPRPPEPGAYRDPGPEPTPPRGMTPDMQRYFDIARDPARGDKAVATATALYNEAKQARDDAFKRQWESWKHDKQKYDEDQVKLPERREELRQKWLTNRGSEQAQLPDAAGGVPGIPQQPGDDPYIGTPRSRQRTGTPTPPPLPPNTAPKDWAAKHTERSAKAIEAVDSAEPDFKSALRVIDEVRNHPGKEWGTGMTAGWAPRGTDAYAFSGGPEEGIIGQLKGKTFLSAYEKLRGGGAIATVEGQKAAQSVAAINPAAGKEAVDRALDNLERQLRSDLETAQRKVNRPVTAWQKTPDDPAAPDIGERGMRGGKVREYIGGNPADDSSYRLVR